MIKIENKVDCCGCSGCANICSEQCISMQEDNEGFEYPVVKKEFCTGCGLCEKICPMMNDREKTGTPVAFVVQNKDDSIIMNSSSGGFFLLLPNM